jgi:hypothetical protein
VYGSGQAAGKAMQQGLNKILADNATLRSEVLKNQKVVDALDGKGELRKDGQIGPKTKDVAIAIDKYFQNEEQKIINQQVTTKEKLKDKKLPDNEKYILSNQLNQLTNQLVKLRSAWVTPLVDALDDNMRELHEKQIETDPGMSRRRSELLDQWQLYRETYSPTTGRPGAGVPPNGDGTAPTAPPPAATPATGKGTDAGSIDGNRVFVTLSPEAAAEREAQFMASITHPSQLGSAHILRQTTRSHIVQVMQPTAALPPDLTAHSGSAVNEASASGEALVAGLAPSGVRAPGTPMPWDTVVGPGAVQEPPPEPVLTGGFDDQSLTDAA